MRKQSFIIPEKLGTTYTYESYKLLISRLISEGKKDSINFINKKEDPIQLGSKIQTINDRVPLKSKTEVLLNFNKSEQKRIIETALNNLRANKSTLDYSNQNFEQDQERINRHDIEWHRKFTLSFACIILFLIGAPLGAIVRKGGLGMPVIFSLVFFILYHMISITGEKLAREGVLSAFEGMLLSSAILLPVGIFLSYKAATDSALFDKEVYIRFFRKLGRSKTA